MKFDQSVGIAFDAVGDGSHTHINQKLQHGLGASYDIVRSYLALWIKMVYLILIFVIT